MAGIQETPEADVRLSEVSNIWFIATSVTQIYLNIRIFEYFVPNIRYSNTNT